MQNQANQTEQDYAKEQAIAKVESIAAMVAAYEMDWDRLEELKDEYESLKYDAGLASPDDEPEDYKYAQLALDTWELDNMDELKELQETAGEYTSQDDALEAIQDHPLSIEYRSGWTTSYDDLTPEEFRVVLCTGGPHVEILGEFDHSGSVDRVRVIYKDWGTSGELFDFDRAVVITYCDLIGVGSF